MKRADLGKPPFRVVCYLPDMSGGGAERMQVELARYMRARGIDYSFLLDRAGGPRLDEATTVAPVQVLAANRQLAALPRLVRYLRQSPPDVLIVNMEHQAVTATIAKYLAGARTKIVVIQHIPLSYLYRDIAGSGGICPCPIGRRLSQHHALLLFRQGWQWT